MKPAGSTDKQTMCSSRNAKRIVIVDDHPLFRKGLEQLIHSDGGFMVCGEAGDAAEAMEVIRKLHPDLAIVDLSLPGANGIELIGKGIEARQIAKQLHLSRKTVETHRAHIKEKLRLKNAREVARFALQWLGARSV